MDVLGAIGNTSIVRLRRVVPVGCAEVWAKLEWENPTGSMKDRMALAVVDWAERKGRLKPGGTMVEYTGGSTGASLALVCAAKGYRLRIVTSNAFSQEKRDHMKALGAELVLVPSENGLSTKSLFLEMIATAKKMGEEPGAHWNDQLNNVPSIDGYSSLGEEIWVQAAGRVDAFVQAVGTGASSRGVAQVLMRHKPSVALYCVEPAESPVLGGGEPGAHAIEGIGIGFAPPLYDASLVKEVLPITTKDAQAMARRLAREEALFAGTSSGANVVAAIEVARRLGPGKVVVTVMIDSGLKYVSTDVYRT